MSFNPISVLPTRPSLIAITAEDIVNPQMQEKMQRAIQANHEPVLRMSIPQNNANDTLDALRVRINESKEALRTRFGFELRKVYNYQKDPILSSVEAVFDSTGVTVISRSFHANIHRPDTVTAQIQRFGRANGGRYFSLIIEVSVASAQDLPLLNRVYLAVQNQGFVVVGGPVPDTAVQVDAQPSLSAGPQPRRRVQVIIDGFSVHSSINYAAIEGQLAGFTVNDSDLKRKSRTIQSALDRGMTPLFRFPSRLDHSLGRQNSKKLARWAEKAAGKFRSQYKQKLRHVLLPFTSDYPKRFERPFERVGLIPLRSTLQLTSGYVQLLDGARGNDHVVCWNVGEENSVEGVNEVLRRFREQAQIIPIEDRHGHRSSQSHRRSSNAEVVDTEEERLGHHHSRRYRNRHTSRNMETVDTEEERLKDNRNYYQHYSSSLPLIMSLLTA